MAKERFRSDRIRRVYDILDLIRPGVPSDEIEAKVEAQSRNVGLESEKRIKLLIENLSIIERVDKTDKERDMVEKDDFVVYFEARTNRLHEPMPLQVKSSVEGKERAKQAIKKKGKRQIVLAASLGLTDQQIISSFFDQLKHFDGFI